MYPHRNIDLVADRHADIRHAPTGRKPAARLRVGHRTAWGKALFWLVLAVAMERWFLLLFGQFQDEYISFILTVLPVVSIVALVRPQSNRRHHGDA